MHQVGATVYVSQPLGRKTAASATRCNLTLRVGPAFSVQQHTERPPANGTRVHQTGSTKTESYALPGELHFRPDHWQLGHLHWS